MSTPQRPDVPGEFIDTGVDEHAPDDDSEDDRYGDLDEEYANLYDEDDDDHTLSTRQDRKRRRWKNGG